MSLQTAPRILLFLMEAGPCMAVYMVGPAALPVIVG